MSTMGIELTTPDVRQLEDVVRVLGGWQEDTAPLQLHPGDLGWLWRHGASFVAGSVRAWVSGGSVVALGMLDGPDVLRLAVPPARQDDQALAERLVSDLATPLCRVLPSGVVSVEAAHGSAVQTALSGRGWSDGEVWQPLARDLAGPVEEIALHVEVVRPGDGADFTAVHRAAWGNPAFTDEVFRTMTTGRPFGAARCLLGRDDDGVPVAGVTVWSAGPGRPGLIEPMGVHPEHRGRGHGTAICRAAARELRELGASRAEVCTPASLGSAIATYRAAGFEALPERTDRTRS